MAVRAIRKSPIPDRRLYLDSGCTSHLLRNDMLGGATEVRQLDPPRVFGGIGGEIIATAIGNGRYIKDICFSKDTPKNLISFAMLREQGYKLSFDHSDGSILASLGNVTLVFSQDKGKMFPLSKILLFERQKAELSYNFSQKFTKDQHERATLGRRFHVALGHMGETEMREAIRRGNQNRCGVTWADIQLSNEVFGPCQVCIRAKATAPVLTKSTREKTTIIGHTQHIDALYFRDTASRLRTMFLFVDEATNKVCVQLATSKSKSQFAESLHSVNCFYLKYGHSPVKRIFCDNESSIVSFEEEFNSSGGEIIFKAPGQHDGLAERYVRVFKDMMRTVLFQLEYTWPFEYFEDLVHEVVQLMDLRDNARTNGVPVYEVVKGTRPDYAFMDIPFGSFGLATNTRPELKKDNQPRAIYGIILRRSYEKEMRYKVLPLDSSSPSAGPFFCKKFQELPIPPEVIDRLNAMSKLPSDPSKYLDSLVRDIEHSVDPNLLNEEQIKRLAQENPDAFDTMQPINMPSHVPPFTPSVPSFSVPSDNEIIPASDHESDIDPDISPPQHAPDFESDIPSTPSPPSRSVKKRVDPVLRDVVHDPNLGRGHRLRTPRVITDAMFNEMFESDSERSDFHTAFASSKVSSNMSLKKASAKHGSTAADAGKKELQGMLDKDTFIPVFWHDLSEEQKSKTIRSFTFYKEKLKVDGSLDKLKARMVAQGQMVDKSTLGEISSPTPGLEALFLLHALGAQFDWKVAVMDIPSAFLHSRLPESQRIPMIISRDEADILFELRPDWKSYAKSDGSLVVLLIGNLYGLPQAPEAFNQDLTAAMLQIGYKKTVADPCIFVKFDKDKIASIVFIYVDDLLHYYVLDKYQSELFSMICSKFSEPTLSVSDEGIHLGLQFSINRADRSVRITMTKYEDKILSDFNITTGARTPTTSDFIVFDDTGPSFDQRKFASALMSIYYLAARTRKDILFPVTALATRTHCCTTKDMEKLDRIFRFLFATRGRGIVLRTRGTRLIFSCDASYAIYPNSRSQSGLHFTLGPNDQDPKDVVTGGPVWCRSTIQKVISTSSYEAEVSSLHIARDFIYKMRSLMTDFGFDQSLPSLVLEDNMAVIQSIAQGDRFRGRSTHINVRVHAFAQLVETGVVEIKHCPTEIMMADVFTKAFHAKSQLSSLLRVLNDYDIKLDDVYGTVTSR